jgi:hypothetical protein
LLSPTTPITAAAAAVAVRQQLLLLHTRWDLLLLLQQ